MLANIEPNILRCSQVLQISDSQQGSGPRFSSSLKLKTQYPEIVTQKLYLSSMQMLNLLEKMLLNLEDFNYRLDTQADVISLTETWLSEADDTSKLILGAKFIDKNRNLKGVESFCNITNFATLQRKVKSTLSKLSAHTSEKRNV